MRLRTASERHDQGLAPPSAPERLAVVKDQLATTGAAGQLVTAIRRLKRRGRSLRTMLCLMPVGLIIIPSIVDGVLHVRGEGLQLALTSAWFCATLCGFIGMYRTERRLLALGSEAAAAGSPEMALPLIELLSDRTRPSHRHVEHGLALLLETWPSECAGAMLGSHRARLRAWILGAPDTEISVRPPWLVPGTAIEVLHAAILRFWSAHGDEEDLHCARRLARERFWHNRSTGVLAEECAHHLAERIARSTPETHLLRPADATPEQQRLVRVPLDDTQALVRPVSPSEPGNTP